MLWLINGGSLQFEVRVVNENLPIPFTNEGFCTMKQSTIENSFLARMTPEQDELFLE